VARHPVTVTASYNAHQAPDDTATRLEAWAKEGDGRTFIVDSSIAPVRWTATADYIVDADNAQSAEQAAVDLFRSDTSAAGIAAPETLVAATGPLR
jgi:hypothetical protein